MCSWSPWLTSSTCKITQQCVSDTVICVFQGEIRDQDCYIDLYLNYTQFSPLLLFVHIFSVINFESNFVIQRVGRLVFLPKKVGRKLGVGVCLGKHIGSLPECTCTFLAFNGCKMVHDSYNFFLFLNISFHLLMIFAFVSL